jgi:peptide/nickel transport system ATP-binding protein
MVIEEFDIAFLMVSHDATVIAELADRVAVMYAGKIMEYGETVRMYHEPKHPYTKGLMASFPTIVMMQMRKGKERPKLRGIPGKSPDLLNPPSGCPFHPRCSEAKDICKQEVPEYREIEKNHYIRCHRYEELN